MPFWGENCIFSRLTMFRIDNLGIYDRQNLLMYRTMLFDLIPLILKKVYFWFICMTYMQQKDLRKKLKLHHLFFSLSNILYFVHRTRNNIWITSILCFHHIHGICVAGFSDVQTCTIILNERIVWVDMTVLWGITVLHESSLQKCAFSCLAEPV